MSFPHYKSHKNSGIEWLGELPTHWEVISLGKIALDKCDGPFGSGLKSEHYTEEGVRVIRLQNVRGGTFDGSDAAFIDEKYYRKHLGGHDVQPGDLIIAGLGDDRNTVGRACVAPAGIAPAMVKADCFRFRLNTRRALPEFVAAQLTAGSTYDAGTLSSGSTRSRIPLSTMAGRKLAIPPLKEQVAIVSFLDGETTKIDALVNEQKRLIELLKQKRQAIISQAVTKGLAPDAPMKCSGVEWLGAVPEHWQVMRIKWVARMESGHTPDKKIAAYWTDCKIPWVSLHDTGFLKDNDFITNTEQNVNELGIANSSARLIPARAVVFSRDATIGRCGITTRPMAVSQHFIAWVCGACVLPEYLLRVLRLMSQELERLTFGATVKTIGMPDVRQLTMPVPPIDEQHAIIKYVYYEIHRLGALVHQIESAITLLIERRSALISAAVTGKIDVRGLVKADAPIPAVVAA